MQTTQNSKILVVVHGRGRGREVPTGKAFQKRLAQTNHSLLQDIRIHETGAGVPSLADVRAIVFWLGDPLQQKYPDCYREAKAIADEAEALGLKVLNHPEALCNTSKTMQARIWSEKKVPSAAVRLVRNDSQLRSAVFELGKPCIVRSDCEHAQRDVTIVRNQEDLARCSLTSGTASAVLRLYDIRQEYRDVRGGFSHLFREYHHKARAFVIGDQVMASHLFFSKSPIVGLSNSLFSRESSHNRAVARKFGYHRHLLDELIEADQQYFNSPVLGRAHLVQAVRSLGLDIAAVDYSIRPDGQVMIWEANPYFWLPEGESSVLSEERHAVQRVQKSFDWMADCLQAATTRTGTAEFEEVVSA